MNNTDRRQYETRYKMPEHILTLTERPDKNYFQVFSCKCPTLDEGERVGRQTFRDQDKADFDRRYYEKDKEDWAESRLIVISNCPRLELSLGANDNNAIHRTVTGKFVIVVDEVDELDIQNLDIGYGSTSGNKRDNVVAILLHNLVVTQSRYDIKFEDKPLVSLHNVTFANPVSLDVYNSDNSVSPILKIVDCKFSGDLDITKDGLNPGSINKIRVENEHVGDDRCRDNSTAETEIVGSRLGFLSTGDIEIKGGMKAMFASNMIEFVQKESVRIIDITQVMLKENHLGFPVSLPPLQVEYSAPASGCSLEPVPSDMVTTLDLTGNQLTRAESPLVSLLQSYPPEEAMALSDLMNLDGTTHLSPCSCTPIQSDTNTTEGQLMVKELKGARCLDGRHKLVARGSYCGRLAAVTAGGGGYPMAEPEPEPGEYSSTSLVAAGLISGLLSALIAALVVGGICCFINRGSTSSRSVSPAVSPKNGTA